MSSPIQTALRNFTPSFPSLGNVKAIDQLEKVHTLPVVDISGMERLNQVLATPIQFKIYDKTLTSTLGLLLTFLPPGDIQLVGGTLKYILGRDWLLKTAEIVAKDHPPDENSLRQFEQQNSDIDIRIWPFDRSKGPEHHASQFLFNIATYFHTFKDLKECFTHEQILNELRKQDGPFSIFEPRIKFSDSEITHETFLASYKKGETELDLYFARVLEDPITLLDEDIYLSIGDHVNYQTAPLTPSGSTLQGWSAVESIVKKVIIPVKTDHHAWLRAMRREIQGYSFAENKEHCFNFAPGTNFEKIISIYFQRKSLATAEEKFMLLLNMAAFVMRVNVNDNHVYEALQKIELQGLPQGILSDFYNAAKEMGWMPVVALLRLTQPLDRSHRWSVQGHFSNLSIDSDKALDIFLDVDITKSEILLKGFAIDFREHGHAGLLYRLNKDQRKIFCEKLLERSSDPSDCVARLFGILLKINFREAQEFMRRHYQHVLNNPHHVDFLLSNLRNALLIKREDSTLDERLVFFINLANKFRANSQNTSLIDIALNSALCTLFESGELRYASMLLQQVCKIGPFNRDPILWMHLLAHSYLTEKSNEMILRMMQLANEWQIWSDGIPYEEQSRFFSNALHLMVKQEQREVWLPVADELVEVLLRSRIPEVYKNEIRAIQVKIQTLKEKYVLETAHIPEDMTRLQSWPNCDQPEVETLFRQTILPLMEKLDPFLDQTSRRNEIIDVLTDFLRKGPLEGQDQPVIAEIQEALYSFALKLLDKNADIKRCRLFLYAILDMLPREDVCSKWLFDLHKSDIFAIESPSFIEWICDPKRHRLGCAFIHRLFDGNLSAPAIKLLKACFVAFSDEMLLSFAAKVSFNFLFQDIPRALNVLRTLSVNRIGDDTARGKDLEDFQSLLLTSPLTEKKCDALLGLSPFVKKVSLQAVEVILRNTTKWPNSPLKVRVWLWYRNLHHLPLSLIESNTPITKEMKDTHAISIKLLGQLEAKAYTLIEEAVLKFIHDVDLIQIILGEKNGFAPDVMQYVREDITSIISCYVRHASIYPGNITKKIFQILQLHSSRDEPNGARFLRSNALMLNLAQKIVKNSAHLGQISESSLENLLEGWQLLQNLVYRIDDNNKVVPNLILEYLKASLPFCKDYAEKIHTRIIETYACSLLNLSHPLYNKFTNADVRLLAKELLSHPLIADPHAAGLEVSPLGIFIKLSVKQMLEPLSAEERKALEEQKRKLVPFNWHRLTPTMNGMLCWVAILYVIKILFIIPYPDGHFNQSQS